MLRGANKILLQHFLLGDTSIDNLRHFMTDQVKELAGNDVKYAKVDF